MEHGPPLFLWQKVHEEFHVEESGRVRSIIGTSDLVDHLGNFGKRSQHLARSLRDTRAFRGPCARCQCPPNPNSSLIQFRQEFRPTPSAEGLHHPTPEITIRRSNS